MGFCVVASMVNRHSAVMGIYTRSRENEMEWERAGFVLTVQTLCSELASFFLSGARAQGPTFVPLPRLSLLDTFEAQTHPNLPLGPGPWSSAALSCNYGHAWLGGTAVSRTRRFGGCLAHVGTRKHRLKASSLQIGDCRHSVVCVCTKAEKPLQFTRAAQLKWSTKPSAELRPAWIKTRFPFFIPLWK